jgi:BirA family biotin operon repressor/biotin-[acetyl-CoA-carboxylase] ligase
MIPWRLLVFETLESTSDYCMAEAKAGAAAGLAVRAARQTAGRGSRGREWVAPEGNVNLSALLRPDLAASDAGLFALLAGVAVADAVARCLPMGAAVTLKWPNDVLLDGAKLAGVLIDAAPAGAHLDWLVIGIGINVAQAPAIEGRRTTSLAAHGVETTAGAVAEAVLAQLGFWLGRLAADGGELRAAWLRRGHPPGTPITIRANGGEISGAFAGLAPDGSLLLARGGNIERINTGEVLLGPLAVSCCSS